MRLYRPARVGPHLAQRYVQPHKKYEHIVLSPPILTQASYTHSRNLVRSGSFPLVPNLAAVPLRSVQTSSTSSSLTRTLLRPSEDHSERVVASDAAGKHQYGVILAKAYAIRNAIVSATQPRTVVFLCPNDSSYIASFLASWLSGATAVPLSPHQSPTEHSYILRDSGASVLLSSGSYANSAMKVANDLGIPFINVDEYNDHSESKADVSLPLSVDPALIIYTSGTTGRPKGVVHTHSSLDAMVRSLVDAWRWSSSDVIIQTLPLHHMHGIVNVVLCALYVGARLEMCSFNPYTFWRLIESDFSLNLFFGVPTMFSKLIHSFSMYDDETQELLRSRLQQFRLVISGSAALPAPLYSKWHEISGSPPLERYGMTETGMILSNPYAVAQRRPARVGKPLSGVEVKIDTAEIDPSEFPVDSADAGPTIGNLNVEVGELLVRGPQIFKEYLNLPEATRQEFKDGWFKTGDIVAKYHSEDGVYQLLGRKSVDILKSAGYKLSALEIERAILGVRGVLDVAVVGVPDQVWGEVVCAVVVLQDLSLPELKTALGLSLANYKRPRKYVIANIIPKNAMGKVNKKELVKWVLGQEMLS